VHTDFPVSLSPHLPVSLSFLLQIAKLTPLNSRGRPPRIAQWWNFDKLCSLCL